MHTLKDQQDLPDESKKCGEKWRTMSEDQKAPYKQKAEELKNKYLKEFAAWEHTYA